MKHRYDIRYRILSRKVGYEHIEVELMSLPVKLFSIHREYGFIDYPRSQSQYSSVIEIKGYLQLFVQHERTELERIKQYIQDYYQEKEN